MVINFDKSSILFSNNLDPSYCDTLSHILGVNNMDSNEKYPGSPLLIGKSKVNSFEEINIAFERRLANWQGETMCQAGRGPMMKAFLNAVPLYQLSTFKIPKKLIKKLDTLQRKFFWGYKSNRGKNCQEAQGSSTSNVGYYKSISKRDIYGVYNRRENTLYKRVVREEEK
ncbi:uncharacterized protein LOC113312917 [Papaver somniferum]|uniref:uncharacterized protein LOC113312917 n=1 Tax=Papaver somniferum TaxID=3469 RepID=UPI000E6F4A2A|nr:uncharacterized protein LOC113312917 [Papaver somniferum]